MSALGASVGGGNYMTLTGTLYFPTTAVTFSNGSSVSNVYTAIVAKQVAFTGGTSLQYDATGLKTGLFSNAVAMVQ